MSPQSCDLLLTKIMPAIEKTVPRHVYPATGEDAAELVQDGLAIAAGMLEADEKAGRVSFPSSIAHYTIQRLKAGRRSHSSSTTDVLSAYALRQGRFTVMSMEATTAESTQENDDNCRIGDTLACRRDDPSTVACRSVDWDSFLATIGRRDRLLLRAIAKGHSLKLLAQRLGISPARITQIKQRIGRDLKLWMGDRILLEVQEETPWRRGLRAHADHANGRLDVNGAESILRFPPLPSSDPEPEAA